MVTSIGIIMADLRLIDIDPETGEVTFVADRLDVPLTERESALQRVVVALMTTPGSMIEEPTWGGGARQLFLMTRPIRDTESRMRMAHVVRRAEESILESEDDNGEYTIVSVKFIDFARLPRGLSAELLVEFSGGQSELLTFPVRPLDVEVDERTHVNDR